mmetsp:Transcript_79065/g.236895  ORF Transcript_79065/g.236895 Transcript_79065/m.236895 type:complete len:454 (+) Transcript_79065:730-2091(+)
MKVGPAGEKISFLKLAVNAVSATHDYSVFGKKLLRILVQYKWDNYAQQQVTKDLIYFLAQLAITTAYVLTLSTSLDVRPVDVFEEFQTHWFLLLGWLLTTTVSVVNLWRLVQRIKSLGRTETIRTFDYQDFVAISYNSLNLVVNLFFLLRDHMPDAFAPAGFRNQSGELQWTPGEYNPDDGIPIGSYLTLQSWVIVFLYMRLLFYFRGSLAFGALMHMVIEVFLQIVPFLALLLVVTLGFSFAVGLLLQHTAYKEPDYKDPGTSLITMVSAGFRFVPPDLLAVRSRWQVALLYMLFLCFVQVVLLNLLIAMMGGSLAQLRADSEVMAYAERAKLVLQQDERLQALILQAERRKKLQRGGHVARHLSRLLRMRLFLQRHLGTSANAQRGSEKLAPRWLHVLMPVTEEKKGGTEREKREAQQDELLKELLATQKAMASQLKAIEAQLEASAHIPV